MILKKQKEADFISLRNYNKIPLPLNNFYKLFAYIVQHSEYKINKSRC